MELALRRAEELERRLFRQLEQERELQLEGMRIETDDRTGTSSREGADRVQRTILDARVIELQSELAETREQAEQKSQEAMRAQEEAEKLQSELAEAREQVSKAQSEVTESREDAAKLRSELAEAREQASKARSEVAEAREEAATLQGALGEALEQASKAEAALADAQATVQRKAGEATNAREEAAKLQSELSEARGQAERRATDVSELLAQTAQLEVELGEARRQLDLGVPDASAGMSGSLQAQAFYARIEALETELAELVVQHSRAQQRVLQAERAKAELADLRQKLELAEERLAPEGHGEKLAKDNQALRLEVELLQGRVAELMTEREELVELAAARELLARQADETEQLRRALAELEARLASAGPETTEEPDAPASDGSTPPESGSVPPPSSSAFGPSMVGLLAGGAVRCAALADNHGLPVEVAGDSALLDGLAAVAGLSQQVAQQARALLPLGEVLELSMLDGWGRVIFCRMFTCAGDPMAIGTYGSAAPNPAQVGAVVRAVMNRMGFAPDSSDGADE